MQVSRIDEVAKAVQLRPDLRIAKAMFYFSASVYWVLIKPSISNPIWFLGLCILGVAFAWVVFGNGLVVVDNGTLSIEVRLGKISLTTRKRISLQMLSNVTVEERQMWNRGKKWTEHVVTGTVEGKKIDLLPSLKRGAAEYLVEFISKSSGS